MYWRIFQFTGNFHNIQAVCDQYGKCCDNLGNCGYWGKMKFSLITMLSAGVLVVAPQTASALCVYSGGVLADCPNSGGAGGGSGGSGSQRGYYGSYGGAGGAGGPAPGYGPPTGSPAWRGGGPGGPAPGYGTSARNPAWDTGGYGRAGEADSVIPLMGRHGTGSGGPGNE